MIRRLIASAILTVGLTLPMAGAAPAAAQGRTCAPLQHEGEGYIVCRVDLRQHQLGLFWRDRKGEPFGSLSALDRHLQAEGRRPLFTMNAGMYHPALDPVGLYIENGRQFVGASTRAGPATSI